MGLEGQEASWLPALTCLWLASSRIPCSPPSACLIFEGGCSMPGCRELASFWGGAATGLPLPQTWSLCWAESWLPGSAPAG